MRKWHLVTYDVRDDRRLRQVAQLLSGYGERLQYSVFRCRLNAIELERLLWELGQVLAEEDNLLVIPLCQQCAEAVRGRGHLQSWKVPPRYRIV
jgi:CRISPR-associated protein Cas2|uniref:CRISPR-associated endoribonuclease Cas2 n=1 Tax=Thermomicrobium roseum TaxID=500 RepID=A0A7C1G3D5_THERO